jgi:hypothetical protein
MRLDPFLLHPPNYLNRCEPTPEVLTVPKSGSTAPEILDGTSRGSHSGYLFKHALVQDAAYGTLLRERRRSLHARIAETLESQFLEVADNQPELLARHCTEAGLMERVTQSSTTIDVRSPLPTRMRIIASGTSPRSMSLSCRYGEQAALACPGPEYEGSG